jgi:hypothetical protein
LMVVHITNKARQEIYYNSVSSFVIKMAVNIGQGHC